MTQRKAVSIDFNHSKPGVLFTTDEEFKQDCMRGVQALLNHRLEYVKENAQGRELTANMFPPLPLMINVLFENGSYANTLIHPESDIEKEYLMSGVKKMVMKYNRTKKVKSVFLIMEAWMGEMSTDELKANSPFGKEMTEEQIQRRVSREWKENKIKKITRIVCEYQTPVMIKDKQHTAVATTIYKLLEHSLLVPDEKLTSKMNEMPDDTNQRRKPWFCFFTEFEDDHTKDKEVLNFNILTAVEFLKAINKLM